MPIIVAIGSDRARQSRSRPPRAKERQIISKLDHCAGPREAPLLLYPSDARAITNLTFHAAIVGAWADTPEIARTMTPEACAHLAARCRIMDRLIRAHGPCALVPETGRSPFESLVRAVAHQQLNGTAADTILRRFRALFPGTRFPTAAKLVTVADEALRSAGFSWAKIAAIRDIAAKTLDGTIPTSRAIRTMSDAAIIDRLVTVRGVGRWTVEMLLIFKLGRPDVLPVDDFGVRNGCRIAFGLPIMPTPKELLALGERWRPHGTTAAWYLWRAADAAKSGPPRKGVTV